MTFVSCRRKMFTGLCATRILQGCNIHAIVSEVPQVVRYSRSRNRASVDVGLIVGFSVTESVPSNKARVVVVCTKNVV